MTDSNIASVLEEFQDQERELARHLLNLRQPPGAELERRLQAIPRSSRARQPRWAPGLAWGVAVLVVGVLLFASPAARARLGSINKIIGDIQLTMLDFYPKAETSLPITSTPMSLAEAQATAPFNFGTPAYLPANLATDPEVVVITVETSVVRVRWRDEKGGFVQLSAQPRRMAQTLVGLESSEAILLNNQPAVLVRGAWDEASRTWSYEDRMTTIIWEIDEVEYKLLAYSDVVSHEELLNMAQSVTARE